MTDDAMLTLATLAQVTFCSLILYAPLECEAVIRASSVATRMSELLLIGYNDDAVNLKRVIGSLPDLASVQSFTELLRPTIASLTPALRLPIENLASHAYGANSPDELAARCDRTRRSIDRALIRVGIKSATQLVNSARIVRGFGALRNPFVSLSRVCAYLGLASPRSLESQCITVTGGDIAMLRRMSDGAELSARIAERLFIHHANRRAIRA